MSDAIDVHVNGEPLQLRTGATVRDLLDRLELGDRQGAVAVNRDVVPRARYADQRLEAEDRIEILEAVGGG